METIDILVRDSLCKSDQSSPHMAANSRIIEFLHSLRPLGKPVLPWLPSNKASPVRSIIPRPTCAPWKEEEIKELARIFDEVVGMNYVQRSLKVESSCDRETQDGGILPKAK